MVVADSPARGEGEDGRLRRGRDRSTGDGARLADDAVGFHEEERVAMLWNMMDSDGAKAKRVALFYGQLPRSNHSARAKFS